jgi:hypothetical protein
MRNVWTAALSILVVLALAPERVMPDLGAIDGESVSRDAVRPQRVPLAARIPIDASPACLSTPPALAPPDQVAYFAAAALRSTPVCHAGPAVSERGPPTHA